MEFWATVNIGVSGSGTAQFDLYDDTGSSERLEASGSPETFTTSPGSDTGTHVFNGGMSPEYVGPGQHTFSLKYQVSAGNGTGLFSDVELVVAPV